MKIALLVLVSSLIQIEAAASTWQQADGKDKDESRRVFDQQKKFSIIPPPGWDSDGQSKSPTTVLSRKSNAKDLFSNFIVKKNKLRVGEQVAVVAKKSLEASKPQLTDFEIVEEGEIMIHNREGYFAFFKAKRNSVSIVAGFYFVRGEGADLYVLNYTVLPDAFERLKPDLKKAASTIQITP